MSLTPTEQTIINDYPDKEIYTKAGETLSNGIVRTFDPPLKDVHNQLEELTEKQRDLIKKLHTENSSIAEVQHSSDLQEMFVKIKVYHSKLQSLKKNIKGLHEKSIKLKKRAIKLQQLKEKEPVEEIIISKPSSSIIGTSNTS